MEEGGRRQHPIINVKVNVIQDGDSVRVAGDYVEKKAEINAGVIDTVNMDAATVQDAEEGVRGNIHADSVAPKSGEKKKQNRFLRGTMGRSHFDWTTEEPLNGQLAKMNLTESNLKASLSEIRAHNHVKKGEYGEAIDILEEILSMTGTNTFSILSMMAECYAQLRQRSNLNSIMDSIKQWILTSDVDYKTIVEIIEQEQDSHPIRAMILRGCLSGVIGKFFGPDEELYKIRWECSLPISQIIQKLADENRAICKNVGIPLITACLEDLRHVSETDDDDKKVKMEAECLNDVGISFRYVGEPSKAIEYYDKGISRMESHFGTNASKYRTLAFLLHNMGNATDDLGQFAKAEEFYLKSIEAEEKSTDWSSDADKQESIERIKKNLQNTRKRMRK